MENKIKEAIVNELTELQKAILLLANADNKTPIRGDTWYQKELFLIVKNIPRLEEDASFGPDFFGPFSEIADEEVANLVQEELLDKDASKIMVTSDGEKVVQKAKESFSKEELELIEEFKKLLNDLNDEELLTLIYFSFKKETSESKVLDKIIKNRIKNSISLYRKNKISLSKAAEIAGKSIEEMAKMVA